MHPRFRPAFAGLAAELQAALLPVLDADDFAAFLTPDQVAVLCQESGLNEDALALALIQQALPLRMPLLAICRGMQELVVATGGTLRRALPAEAIRHHADDDRTLAEQYAPTHAIALTAEGRLSQLLRGATSIEVNSLHKQGVLHPGPLLQIEATAPDGVIEAVAVPNHPFAIGVQWHPEWRYQHTEASTQLFGAFIHACHQFTREKRL